MSIRFGVLALSLALVSCGDGPSDPVTTVKTGADLLISRHLGLIEGKKLGVVTNHTGILSDGRHLVDALRAMPSVTVVALFGPEHGIRGDAPDGRTITDGRDAATGIPVYSLYGRTNKPTPEMLREVDVLVYDIQDVGARFYTYTSTLSLTMEAAAEKGIPYIVLDRPNPIRGTMTEGFVREDTLRSFVGLHPIPIAYGMTAGELAGMINGERWLKDGVAADLRVVECEGWKRTMWYDETGLRWTRPSPNMPYLSTATVYPGMCLFEGTNLSEGRGSEKPFEYIGAPYVDGEKWSEALNRLDLPGVTFEPASFTPVSIPGVTSNPKHEGTLCGGVYVSVTDRDALEPVRTFVHMVTILKSLYPTQFEWRRSSIDRLSGTPVLRTSIDRGTSAEDIAGLWSEEVGAFRGIREKYLIYPD